MSLTLAANTLAVTQGVSTSFAAQGGTPPYVYSVIAGGAGGSIGASTGIYTAPASVNDDPKKAYDTVRVTDSLGATADLNILVGTPVMLLCDIIKNELGLSTDQVWVYNQKVFIPTDSRLYVTVAIMNPKAFANSIKYNSSGNAVQSVNMLVQLDINIMSRSALARDHKEDVILALGSVYAEQQQELNSFSIGRLPKTFVNISEEDGAAIPYRYVISVNMQYMYTKTKTTPYFDTFQSVSIEKTEP